MEDDLQNLLQNFDKSNLIDNFAEADVSDSGDEHSDTLSRSRQQLVRNSISSMNKTRLSQTIKNPLNSSNINNISSTQQSVKYNTSGRETPVKHRSVKNSNFLKSPSVFN